MPDDQLKQFSRSEIRSLFAYLRGKAQVPMIASKENATPFSTAATSPVGRATPCFGRSKTAKSLDAARASARTPFS